MKAVLLEIGQILERSQDRFAVNCGAEPWLLLGNEDMPHVGTIDVGLSLDAAGTPRSVPRVRVQTDFP